MHKVNVFLITVFVIYSRILYPQSNKEFLVSYLEEEKKRGATDIILYATWCHLCTNVPFNEAYIFIRDSFQTYKIKYIMYDEYPTKMKVLKDIYFIDDNIKYIFEIFESNKDSIIYQIQNIDKLLRKYVIKGDSIFYIEYSLDGKIKYLNIEYKSYHLASLISNNINELFPKAYYYWLLNSAINNYINDILRDKIYLHEIRTKKKKH